ncbi:M28 family metallopeptidase [Alteromonas sp. C1M14]|uniref:M28 family metallopeptidase n=1 Tax=Alteromonas sp. C1M14 TaxID=2841567 RepID=UPI001C093A87|nr:M28 family metallopeptidase [Alteromonas sp. C1M14]MBU2978268.1 M28 family peptidase [Alteromonas sp. C1M14]
MFKPFIVSSLLLAACQSFAATSISPLGEQLNLDNFRKDVQVLASDDFEGRAPLSEGEQKTVDYIVSQFKSIGLKPAFGDSYIQKVPLAKITADQNMSLTIGDMEFKNGSDFTARTQRISESIAVNDDVVFAGYGIVAPEYNWNDYANIDVKGKTVIVLVNDPGFASKDDDLFTGNAMTYYGRWTYKYEEAARQGAKALFIVHETMPAGYGWGVVQNSNTNTKYALVDDNDNQSQVGVMGWIQLRAAEKIFAAAGLNYRELKAEAAKPGFTAIDLHTKAKLALHNRIEHAESQNLAALLPGTSAADEWIGIHAHWDHLGKAIENGKEVVLNGAVDNASGVAGVLELARVLKKQSSEKPFKRTLMFSAFTAEETGLLGAEHFAKNPPIDQSQIVAFLNIDGMNVNASTDYILQYGSGLSELEDYVADTAASQGRYVKPDPRPQNGLFFRSDHFAAARQGIPSYLFMSLGDTDPSFIAKRYHKAADDYLPEWNLGGVRQDLDLIGQIMVQLADNGDWPAWTTESDFKAARKASGR